MGKIVLVCGVSGAGKTTAIKELLRMDQNLELVRTYTTRELRLGESGRVHVTSEEMDMLINEGKVFPNEIYGNRYGASIADFVNALHAGKIPIIDYPIDKVQVVKDYFKNDSVICVYIKPPSLEVLTSNLKADGRVTLPGRMEKAVQELHDMELGKYSNIIDLEVINRISQISETAAKIKYFYEHFAVSESVQYMRNLEGKQKNEI